MVFFSPKRTPYVRPKTGKTIRPRAKCHYLRWLFPITGLFALIWFLIRVIPKPSRATYPCQRVMFPIASGFIVWLLGIFGSLTAYHKARRYLGQARYIIAAVCIAVSVAFIFAAVSTTDERIIYAHEPQVANDPLGTAIGVNPGRVAWIHDPDATDWVYTDVEQTEHWYEHEHSDQAVVSRMFSKAIRALTGEKTDTAAWDAIFREFNQRHGRGDVGYRAGEKIGIKINHTLSCGADAEIMDKNPWWGSNYMNFIDNSPQLTIALLRQLIDNAGVAPNDISIGDPGRIMPNYWYDMVEPNCPGVVYIARAGGKGRTQSQWSAVEFDWSDPCSARTSHVTEQDHIPVCFAGSDYFINFPVLKSHGMGGVTICGKNSYGSLIRNPDANDQPTATDWYDMHDTLPGRIPGMQQYRCLVDLMGHPELGGKTLLCLVDALFAGIGWDGQPVEWEMAPFNGDWPSSIFVSMDQVAVDSVGFDFLYEEWSNYPHMSGADDYLHEAALANDPCSGATYDPNNDGGPIESLGVHEHWNNATDKQYTRDLDPENGTGIELSTEVPASGDFDDSNGVDFPDFATFAAAWGTVKGEGNFDPNCDISIPSDGVIDVLDLAEFSKYWLNGIVGALIEHTTLLEQTYAGSASYDLAFVPSYEAVSTADRLLAAAVQLQDDVGDVLISQASTSSTDNSTPAQQTATPSASVLNRQPGGTPLTELRPGITRTSGVLAVDTIADSVNPATDSVSPATSPSRTTGEVGIMVETTTTSNGARVYNVRDYGAAGDGASDDTTEIQSAIDTAEAAGGGIVYFPAGRYIVTSQLTVQASNVRLLGDGLGVSEIIARWSPGDLSAVLYIRHPSAGAYEQLSNSLEALTICGDGTNTRVGVEMHYITSSIGAAYIRDCWITNFTDKQVYLNNCWSMHMENCVIGRNAKGNYGIYAENGNNIYIEHCRISRMAPAAVGIYLTDAEGSIIANCDIEQVGTCIKIPRSPNGTIHILGGYYELMPALGFGADGCRAFDLGSDTGSSTESIIIQGGKIDWGKIGWTTHIVYCDKVDNVVIDGLTHQASGGMCYFVTTTPNSSRVFLRDSCYMNDGSLQVNDLGRAIVYEKHNSSIYVPASQMYPLAGSPELTTKMSIRSSAFAWAPAANDANAFYFQTAGGTDPQIPIRPSAVYENGEPLAPGTLGSLDPNQYAFSDDDSLGYNTMYVQLAGGKDPDANSVDWVEYESAPGNFQAYAMKDGADREVGFDIKLPANWGGSGNQVQLWLLYTSPADTNNFVLGMGVNPVGEGQDLRSAAISSRATATPSEHYHLKLMDFKNWKGSFTQNDLLRCTVRRDGDAGKDDSAQTCYLLGVEIRLVNENFD